MHRIQATWVYAKRFVLLFLTHFWPCFRLRSKIDSDTLDEAVAGILKFALEEKKRGFLETVELQVLHLDLAAAVQ